MLLNLHKKSWVDGLSLQDFNTHCTNNEKTVKEMLELAKNYHKVSSNHLSDNMIHIKVGTNQLWFDMDISGPWVRYRHLGLIYRIWNMNDYHKVGSNHVWLIWTYMYLALVCNTGILG